ncbi:storkhead-box protein 1-like [Eptesicus fuscus]|uniref:storkhead-box protein 1-like n=1 Tax=Eptesicus fuscus TaxID=29078 RepID=UPI002403AC6F|nr:storkhead-box protein 1-like [Eptesicus fuscus]
MPPKMEKFLQIAPHSLAIVLGPAEGPPGERSRAAPPAPPAQPRQLARHHIGYEIFADFKAENMQHFWNRKVTAAVAETFFLGWIDEQVLLVQGKEEHLEALREGWARRALRPPAGFHIRCLGGRKNVFMNDLTPAQRDFQERRVGFIAVKHLG